MAQAANETFLWGIAWKLCPQSPAVLQLTAKATDKRSREIPWELAAGTLPSPVLRASSSPFGTFLPFNVTLQVDSLLKGPSVCL